MKTADSGETFARKPNQFILLTQQGNGDLYFAIILTSFIRLLDFTSKGHIPAESTIPYDAGKDRNRKLGQNKIREINKRQLTRT